MREIKFEFIYSDGTVFLKAKATFEELCDNNAPNDYMYEKALNEMYEDYQGVENFDIVCKRQSTGLKDNNGVDIFMGDIVFITNVEAEQIPLEVYFEKSTAGFALKVTSCHWCYFDEATQKETKVIGNIYENPEWREL